jgi:hypothetical protein
MPTLGIAPLLFETKRVKIILIVTRVAKTARHPLAKAETLEIRLATTNDPRSTNRPRTTWVSAFANGQRSGESERPSPLARTVFYFVYLVNQ